MGLARRAKILPQEIGFEAACGGLESAQGISASAAQSPDGVVHDLWDMERRQIPRAHQAGQVDVVAAVGCAPIPGLLQQQGG